MPQATCFFGTFTLPGPNYIPSFTPTCWANSTPPVDLREASPKPQLGEVPKHLCSKCRVQLHCTHHSKTHAEEKQVLECPWLMTLGTRTSGWPCKVTETWTSGIAQSQQVSDAGDDLSVNHMAICDQKAQDRVITCTEDQGLPVSWQIGKGYLGLESQTRQDPSSQGFKRSLELSFFPCALTLKSLLLKCSFHPSLPANPFLIGNNNNKKSMYHFPN